MIKENTKANIKPGYKKTKVGVIPEDWEVKRIKSVADVIGGGTPSTTEVKYWNGNINWFTPSEIKGKFVSKSERKITKAGLKNSSAKELPRGTILLTTRATIGEASLSTEISTTNQGFQSLVCKKGTNNVFLYELIKFNKNELYRRANGSTFLEISGKEIKQIPLAIPPLPEQKAIADCLSTWDKGIAKLSALIASKKEQKKGLMQQLLTGKKRLDGFTEEWKEVRLGDIAYITTGASNKQDAGDGFKYVFFDRSSDVLTSKIFLYDCEAIIVPGEGADFIPKYFVGKFDLHQRAYAIMDFKNVLGKYIFYYLINDRKHLHRQAVGSTVKSLRLPYFKNMPMRIPSFEEQATIAEVLTTADKEIELLEKKLEIFKIQKKGLMQVLLTGERRLV